MDEQTFRKILREALSGFPSKEELKSLATKDDLKGFATKADLRDLATKDDLKALATKQDLKLELKLLQNNLEDFISAVFASTDANKADKGDVEVLKKKVKRLEETSN